MNRESLGALERVGEHEPAHPLSLCRAPFSSFSFTSTVVLVTLRPNLVEETSRLLTYYPLRILTLQKMIQWPENYCLPDFAADPVVNLTKKNRSPFVTRVKKRNYSLELLVVQEVPCHYSRHRLDKHCLQCSECRFSFRVCELRTKKNRIFLLA